jgi:starvation-inducible DNA-binding protein
MKTLDRREAALETLEKVLGAEFALLTKTRGYHWNVEGPNFSQLHALFQSQYEQLDGFVDQVAERSRALGRYARIDQPASTGAAKTWKAMVMDLEKDHESLAAQIEVAMDFLDAGTADLLTGMLEEHQKQAWMLRATAAER